MQGDTERTSLGPTADLFHAQKTVIVHRYDLLPCVDGLTDGIGHLVTEPSMGDQRPAAEVDRIDVRYELSIPELPTFDSPAPPTA